MTQEKIKVRGPEIEAVKRQLAEQFYLKPLNDIIDNHKLACTPIFMTTKILFGHPLFKQEGGERMKDWECVKCGHLVIAKEKPQPIKWTDGHVCNFKEVKEKKDD